MPDPRQLDLFGDRPTAGAACDAAGPQRRIAETLSDQELISAIPGALLAQACALAAEAGRRRLGGAVPALVALCDHFVGYGADAIVPEQAAALEALALIGGPEASRSLVRLIVKRTVQGSTLVVAMRMAAQLRVVLPIEVARDLLRHPDPGVRASACACVRASHEIVASLIAMLGDPLGEVSIAAACALGRMGRTEALVPLKRYLTERPSVRVVEALAGVADDEAIVFLSRAARVRPDLTASIIAALEDIDSATAATAASRLKRLV